MEEDRAGMIMSRGFCSVIQLSL